MLSRTADSLYWTGRYMERAENTARMLDVRWLAIGKLLLILLPMVVIGTALFTFLAAAATSAVACVVAVTLIRDRPPGDEPRRNPTRRPRTSIASVLRHPGT